MMDLTFDLHSDDIMFENIFDFNNPSIFTNDETNNSKSHAEIHNVPRSNEAVGLKLQKSKAIDVKTIKRPKRKRSDSPTKEGRVQNSWQQMYNELRNFHEEHGHCLVNVNTSKLGRWVERMRKERKRGVLKEDKVRKLSELGFVWQRRTKSANCKNINKISYFAAPWQQKFEELKKYIAKHGMRNLGMKFGSWIGCMRHQRKHGALSAEKIRQLNEIGFPWKDNVVVNQEEPESVRYHLGLQVTNQLFEEEQKVDERNLISSSDEDLNSDCNNTKNEFFSNDPALELLDAIIAGEEGLLSSGNLWQNDLIEM